MAWRAIPGFLFKDFWFPFTASHIVKPVVVPTKDCETLCAGRQDCCRWAVRDVRSMSDAQDADGGLVEMGWEITGDDVAAFVGPALWCDNLDCGAAGATTLLKLEPGKAGAKELKFTFTPKAGGKADPAVMMTLLDIPGARGGNSFYALLTVTHRGWTIFDRSGAVQHVTDSANVLTVLRQEPTFGLMVNFVRSYSCGLFKKETSVARLTVEALPGKVGLLEKCGSGEHPAKCEGSSCDPEAALAAQMERLGNGRWSGDALAGSHGISFASIACAVFASVALVFVVLFVAKKNSHLEVALADE